MFRICNDSPAHQAQDLLRLFPDQDVLGIATEWRDIQQAIIDNHQFLIAKNNSLTEFLRAQVADADRFVQALVHDTIERKEASPPSAVSEALANIDNIGASWHPWNGHTARTWIEKIETHTSSLTKKRDYLIGQVNTINPTIDALTLLSRTAPAGDSDVITVNECDGLEAMEDIRTTANMTTTESESNDDDEEVMIDVLDPKSAASSANSPALVFKHADGVSTMFFNQADTPTEVTKSVHIWDDDDRKIKSRPGHYIQKYPGYYYSSTGLYVNGFDILPMVVIVRPDGLYASKLLAFYCDDRSTASGKYHTTIVALPPASVVYITMLECWPKGHIKLSTGNNFELGASVTENLHDYKNYSGQQMFKFRSTEQSELEFRPAQPWLDELKNKNEEA